MAIPISIKLIIASCGSALSLEMTFVNGLTSIENMFFNILAHKFQSDDLHRLEVE